MTEPAGGAGRGVKEPRALRTDVLVAGLILAFTAVPTQLRMAEGQALIDAIATTPGFRDFVVNVLGYVLLGLVLTDRGPIRAVGVAALLSISSEAAQLFEVGRSASVWDVAANVAGAGLGVALGAGWRKLPSRLVVTPGWAALSAVGAVAFLASGGGATVEGTFRRMDVLLTAPSWVDKNARGDTAPGRLEGHWPLDSVEGGRVTDASGNGLSGRAVNAPSPTSGVLGGATALDGHQWIDLGDPVPLRLTGSLTLSAWVHPRAFPPDDAAIISSRNEDEVGYQLDLTIDEGPRTIGFKLMDGSGGVMARYGRTPIARDRWAHVAAVYDARSRTMDVYLNGRPDNGCLEGTVEGRQKVSDGHVFLGRRAAPSGFEFIGVIDDAKIYSRSLSPSEIRAEVEASRGGIAGFGGALTPKAPDTADTDVVCAPDPSMSQRSAGPLVLVGVLAALAFTGLVRGAGTPTAPLAGSLLAGLVASSPVATGITLRPAWLALLYAVAGGMIVVAASRLDRPVDV